MLAVVRAAIGQLGLDAHVECCRLGDYAGGEEDVERGKGGGDVGICGRGGGEVAGHSKGVAAGSCLMDGRRA